MCSTSHRTLVASLSVKNPIMILISRCLMVARDLLRWALLVNVPVSANENIPLNFLLTDSVNFPMKSSDSYKEERAAILRWHRTDLPVHCISLIYPGHMYTPKLSSSTYTYSTQCWRWELTNIRVSRLSHGREAVHSKSTGCAQGIKRGNVKH